LRRKGLTPPGSSAVESAWPWIAIAGLGALHGLNPASGWPWAAACGWRGGGNAAALRALRPLAVGLHMAAMLGAAGGVAVGAGRLATRVLWGKRWRRGGKSSVQIGCAK
jgi:hypothetical protein